MITTFITIRPHLAEYAKAVFAVPDENYIQVPRTDDLYHIISNLMQKRPEDCPVVTKGNLEIALPARSRGKCPLTYNYISVRASDIIEKKIEALFWAHLHEFVDEYRHKIRKENAESVFHIKDCVYIFMQKFRITEITDAAIVKHYYRWRESIRRQLKKRNYNLSQKSKNEHI